MSKSIEFRTWAGMIARCKSNNKRHKDYYDKGITVSPEWGSNFQQFYKDMGSRPTNGHSLDRIDNEKGYSKENCRWATRSQQQRNRSVNAWVEIEGESYVLADAADRLGTKINILTALKSNWKKIGRNSGVSHGKPIKFF